MPLGSMFKGEMCLFPYLCGRLAEQGKERAVQREKGFLCYSSASWERSAGITFWTEMKEAPSLGGGDKGAISFSTHSNLWGSMYWS